MRHNERNEKWTEDGPFILCTEVETVVVYINDSTETLTVKERHSLFNILLLQIYL